jgi:fluoride ion exporter CrcB/FEX
MLILYVLKDGVMGVLTTMSSMHKMSFILAQFNFAQNKGKCLFKTIKNNKNHEKDNLDL